MSTSGTRILLAPDVDLVFDYFHFATRFGVIYQARHAALRAHPRFREKVIEAGLPEYWREFGFPDVCRPRGEDDFACD